MRFLVCLSINACVFTHFLLIRGLFMRLLFNSFFQKYIVLSESKLGLMVQLGGSPCFAGQASDCAGCLAHSINGFVINAPFNASLLNVSFIIHLLYNE